MIMQSPDDYDFDDPKYQAELDRLLDRLAARGDGARPDPHDGP